MGPRFIARDSDVARQRKERDGIGLTVAKGLLYAIAVVLYLRGVASLWGIVSCVVAVGAALFFVDLANRYRLRPRVVVVIAPISVGFFALLSRFVLDWFWVSNLFGLQSTFMVAEILVFSCTVLTVVFSLRYLSERYRVLSILEVLFIAGAVVVTMASHRNYMLNRPRIFSDWAWMLGITPTTFLVALGAVATIFASFLFLRRQSLFKLMITLVLLLALGGSYFALSDRRIAPKDSADALGLSGKKDKGKSGKGENENPFKNDYGSSKPPQPVAIAILRDDYRSKDGILYFRQRALSEFNGQRLVASNAWDQDVIEVLPYDKPIHAAKVQNEQHHLRLPTTMFLLTDHPQPPALTHATTLSPASNPNPSHFVAAYEVMSLVAAVEPERLIGRASIPEAWNEAQITHYTEVPDDPRYATLADMIVRGIDPRFSSDPLARALAIKKFLEKEGFYSLRSKHADEKDPTASFLFGTKRGYCVHFAHAAVYLFRTQGIAARVALGYAVPTLKRSGGSAVLVMGDRAHAWPEIHIEGVGWITLDIYPERTDMPPARAVDYDLEKLLGELARKDPTGGISPEGQPVVIPWRAMIYTILVLLLIALCALYAIKLYRLKRPTFSADAQKPRAIYIAALDRLAEVGFVRHPGETREHHAERVSVLSGYFAELTHIYLALCLGSRESPDPVRMQHLLDQIALEIRRKVPIWKRILGRMSPISWLFVR